MKIKELNVKDYVRKKKERKGKVLKALQNRELFQLKKFLRTSLVSVKVFFPVFQWESSVPGENGKRQT